jgi:hypothetical protein
MGWSLVCKYIPFRKKQRPIALSKQKITYLFVVNQTKPDAKKMGGYASNIFFNSAPKRNQYECVVAVPPPPPSIVRLCGSKKLQLLLGKAHCDPEH